MSLHVAAQHLAQKGRGRDKKLVHMTPRELAGLEALARAKGGSLSTNPETGLPEAGFLEDILPIVAAGAATYFTAGAAAPLLMSAGMGATSAGILAGAGAGALIGGGSAAIQGGDVGKAALMGGVIGGIGGGIGAPGEAPVPTDGVSSTAGTSAAGANAPVSQATQVGTQAINVNPASGAVVDPLAGAGNTFSYTPSGEMVPSNYSPQITGAQPPAPPAPNPADIGKTANQLAGDRLQQQEAARVAAAQKDPNASWWSKQSNLEKAGYTTAGTALLSEMARQPTVEPVTEEESRLKRISPNFRAQAPIQPNPYYRAQYPVYAAGGGLMDAYQGGGPVERMSALNTSVNPQGGLYPQGMIDKTQYATPTQRPTSMEMLESEPAYERSNPMIAAAGMASGGIASLGSYSDGGRMLKGPGDGMSDSIPGIIGNKQPARLADGEFVVPADVVSHLGNGSTDAGAKKLYAMMDRVRQARTGKKKQAPAVKTDKLIPRMA